MAKQTPLFQIHKDLNAKLIPFAGYEMPIRYESDKAEHMAVRNAAGIFDVSHMGEFIIRGPKAFELVQKVTSNDVSRLVDGKAQYSCLPNTQGGIIDDLIVYRIKEDQYMMVVNASNIEKDWEWVKSHNSMGAEMIDVSEETALLAVSGPLAEACIQGLTDFDLSQLKTYWFYKGTFDGAEKSLVATTGYTGERTFEIFLYREHAVRIWQNILEAGAKHGLIPTGLGARDTLRLEMGYMLYGNDITDETSPLEAGLSWITKMKKGDFVGRDAIAALKEKGVERKLVAFKLKSRGIPRHGYEVAKNGEVIGTITSGGISPVTGEGIGMAYVPVAEAQIGNELEILIRKKSVPAEIVKTPFIPRG